MQTYVVEKRINLKAILTTHKHWYAFATLLACIFCTFITYTQITLTKKTCPPPSS